MNRANVANHHVPTPCYSNEPEGYHIIITMSSISSILPAPSLKISDISSNRQITADERFSYRMWIDTHVGVVHPALLA